MNHTSMNDTLSVITLNWVSPIKDGWLLKWPKTKFMKIQLSPGVLNLLILVIFGHECYIE